MVKSITFALYLALLYTIVGNEAARILAVFPVPSTSHQSVFRPLTQELVKRGHSVTVLTTDPAFPQGQAPENLTEIDLHDLSYKRWEEYLAIPRGKEDDLLQQVTMLFDLHTQLFETQMMTREVQHILNQPEDAYDLLLIEACVRPALSLTYKFKAPTILISSFGLMYDNYETVGVSTHFFLYPVVGRRKLYNLTNWEKIVEIYNSLKIVNMYVEHEMKENESVRKIFGQDTPPLTALRDNVDMVFTNMHPIFEGNVPVPKNVIHIWGIHEKPQKKLPAVSKTNIFFYDHSRIPS